ncbi:MAG: tetratricopeptide repeat protein [candidate division Zixibacteria bacterium]|nr:tetratricopeptide repeat protein [candidate division Zixibacteria bacterium]
MIAVFAWVLPRRARLREEDEKRLHRAEKAATEAKRKTEIAIKNIESIQKHLGIPVYADGLPTAQPSVFDPFLQGTNLMNAYKWDEAITAFQKAMREAKASQLVALYNLIALCYYTSGRLKPALENFEESASLAEQFDDKQGKANALGNIGLIYFAEGELEEALKYYQDALRIHKEIGFKKGEAAALGNIGLIYQAKGDLDEALKYHQNALKIDKEIGYRKGETSDLGNIANVHYLKGDLDQALKYHQRSLEISKQIGHREYEASELGNIGNVYYLKGDLDQALKYLNEVLKIFEEIGMLEQIEKTKRNIERISQQMKQMKNK